MFWEYGGKISYNEFSLSGHWGRSPRWLKPPSRLLNTWSWKYLRVYQMSSTLIFIYILFLVWLWLEPHRDGWSVMNVSCWQIPPGLWFSVLSYGMRTKWTIFQACKYVTNDSARTIDSNHSDTMFHSQNWLWLYKLLASSTANPCTTCFDLDQSARIFVSVLASNLNTFFPKYNELFFYFLH